MANDKLLSTLGLCRRAGKTVCGVDEICKRMREKKDVLLVLVAKEISDNTRKKISDKCSFYGVPAIFTEYDMIKLGSAVGKHNGSACVAVTDSGFFEAIKKNLL